MTEHVIARTEELSEGERILAQLEGREIAVFQVEGEYYAYTNWCAHQGGPVCDGSVTGTWDAEYDETTQEVEMEWCREDEVLNCPWHGWEYDVRTGESLASEARLLSHPVRVEGSDIVVDV